MKGKVKCSCGHSWNTSDSSKKDASVCHICGKDNTMKDGGWLEKYQEGGEVITGRKDFSPGILSNVPGLSSLASGNQPGYNRHEKYSPLGDLYRYYGGLPLEHNVLMDSQYKPTDSKNKNAKYISLNRDPAFVNEVLDNYKRVASGKLDKGESKLGDNNWQVSGYSSAGKDAHKTTKQGSEHHSNAIGRYTLGKGKDEKGEYISYYDKFDQATGLGINPGELLGLTKPFEIYDRIYIDSKTGKPEMAMGGSMPGAVGFTYARTNDPAPSNGKYAKKTMASAQDGKTIYSGMLPEITIVGSKDSQTEEYYRNMMDRLTKEEGLEEGVLQSDPIYNNAAEVDEVFSNPISTNKILGRYEGLMDLGKKYGFPKVHPIDKNSLLSKLAMSVGGDKKSPPNYDPSSKTIQADSTKQWVSEMAHHVQMKDNKLNKGIQFMRNDLPALVVSEIMLGNRRGPYYTPGAVEYEAHSIIEPKLKEEIKKSESDYKKLPYINKLKDEFYESVESLQNGGEMRYYQEGLDFKPKSISRDGGWLSNYEEGGVIQDDMGQYNHPGEITEIGSNQITMQGVPYPVLGISDTGDMQMMYPNQEYQYDGNSVTEYPMMQNGGVAYVDSVLNANKNLNWVKRLYDVNRKSIMLPGQEDPSTHFMESGDGRVYPTVVEMPNGKLKHLGDKAYDYADSTNTFIQFPNDDQASWFGKNYKQGTGVLKKKKQGGQLTKLDQLLNFTNYNTKQPGGWLDRYDY